MKDIPGMIAITSNWKKPPRPPKYEKKENSQVGAAG